MQAFFCNYNTNENLQDILHRDAHLRLNALRDLL